MTPKILPAATAAIRTLSPAFTSEAAAFAGNIVNPMRSITNVGANMRGVDLLRGISEIAKA